MEAYINSVQKRFSYYKTLGERAIAQLDEEQLFIRPSSESNSIAIIINHLYGNMLSRWTRFYEEDGEKEWRDRDAEFEVPNKNAQALFQQWNEGWKTVLNVIDKLTPESLLREVRIRGEKHSVVDAINRQMTHYAYHIGEIVFLAKMIKNEAWQSLSIPKGESISFNRMMKFKTTHPDMNYKP